MNSRIIAAGLFLSFATAQSALAHGGHEPPVAPTVLTEAQVKLRVAEEITRLIETKKIPESWKEGTVRSVERKPTPAGWEWVATVENAKGKDNEKTLFVFFKPAGQFVAANFSGK